MGQKLVRGSEQVEVSINHVKFVKARILKQPQRQIIITTVPCDEKAYNSWREVLQKYKSIQHQHLLLPLSHRFRSSGVCATRGSLQMAFENYPYLLTDEIYDRRGKKQPFTEPEMWYLLYAYLLVRGYLQECCQYPYSLVGDVRPDNVFINDKGEVKFSCQLSWPGEKVNYRKTFDGITTYLSPEDFEQLQLGEMSNQKNSRSQLFSIGFTLVAVALLRENSDVYNIDKQKLDQYQVKKRVNKFKCLTGYSELLRGIVASLCSFQPQRRVDVNDLLVWIGKYSHNIVNKQPFMVDEVPTKINQHINRLRADILALEPGTSTLNLTSIRSLKGSQAKDKLQSQIQHERSEIKYLKQADGKEFNQNEKRQSRIVINAGQAHKVFFSPTNGAYFNSKVGEGSQITQLKSQLINQQGSRIQMYYSPPRVYQGGNSNAQYEGQKVARSPEGYYSPRSGVNKFRVFIQYKSPSKPIEKPFAETIYLGKEGQAEGVIKVGGMVDTQGVRRKNSDSKSQKSNKSNRQNRFIEETIRESSEKREIRILDEEVKKSGDVVGYKKESPIHQITLMENVKLCEAVSEEILLPRPEGGSQVEVNDKKVQVRQLESKTSLEEVGERKQQSQSVGEDIQQKVEYLQKAFPQGIEIQQEKVKDHQEGLKQTPYVSQADELRLRLEEEINRMTYDRGDHRVAPQLQDIVDHVQVQEEEGKMTTQKNQEKIELDIIANEIFPVQLQTGSHEDQQNMEDDNKMLVTEQQQEDITPHQLEGHLSAEVIIEQSISSQKQPEELKSVSHSQLNYQENVVPVTNQENILIVDQGQVNQFKDSEHKIEEEVVNLEEKLHEINRPLIPLGPESIKNNEVNVGQQVLDQQIQLESIQHAVVKEKKAHSPFEEIQQQNKQPNEVDQLADNHTSQQVHAQNEANQNIIEPVNQSEEPATHIQRHQEAIQQQTQPQEINQLQMQMEEKLQSLHQSVADVSLSNDRMVAHYETSPQIDETEVETRTKIVFNVIEVNDTEEPLPNDADEDSSIQGEGKPHSRLQIEEEDPAAYQVMIQKRLYHQSDIDYEGLLLNGGNGGDGVVRIQKIIGQKVVAEPIEVKESQLRNSNINESQIRSSSASNKIRFVFDDPFLKDVQNTNERLKELQAVHTEDNHNLQNGQNKLHSQLNVDVNAQVDKAIDEVDVVLEQVAQHQHRDFIEQLDEFVQEAKENLQAGIEQIENVNDPASQLIKDSANSNDQYKIVIDDVQQSQDPSYHRGILPVQSNEKYQIQFSNNDDNNDYQQVHQSGQQQDQDKLIKVELESLSVGNLDNQHLYDNNDSVDVNQVNLNELQVSLPRAPTQSEFGNISEIMDINRVFNNTLNGKEMNFLYGTHDPKSEEFLKELMRLSQQGGYQESDLQRVKMTRQDRGKLAEFMRKWQQFNPQHEQSAQEYIDEFCDAIYHSQNGNKQDDKQDDNKLHMSAQDKETLKIVVERLNEKGQRMLEQLENSPGERKVLANYDQSYVDIKYSELKTEIVPVEKDGAMETDGVKKELITVQENEHSSEEKQKKRLIRGGDLIDEVIQLNDSLNKVKLEVQNELQQVVKQQQGQPIELSEKFSLEANPPTDDLVFEKYVSDAEYNNEIMNKKVQSSPFDEIILLDQQLPQVQIYNMTQNQYSDLQQNHSHHSEVNASKGERSEREDVMHEEGGDDKTIEYGVVANLHLLTNHKTYSQPNSFSQRGIKSAMESPSADYLENEQPIIEDLPSREDATEMITHEDNLVDKSEGDRHFVVNLEDVSEQINAINEFVVTPIIETSVKVDEGVQEVLNVMKQVKTTVEQAPKPVAVPRRRTVRQDDFLDQVMQVNKIINKQEDKDYYQNNKYLAEHKSL